MASASLTPSLSFCLSSTFPSSTTRKQPIFSLSSSVVSVSVVPASNSEFSRWVIQPGLCQFSQWNGLKNLGISASKHPVKIERKGKCKDKGVYASLFGVGAPEALVIGVVALLVFGPKGLAEVARNLGKTLRAFQPTIREIQEVSKEFKSTLEREIGLDDIQTSAKNTYSSTSRTSFNSSSETTGIEIDPTNHAEDGSPSPNKAYSSEDYLKITEEQLTAASAAQQIERTPGESPSEIQTPVSQLQSGTASPSESQSQTQAASESPSEIQTPVSQQQSGTLSPSEGQSQTQAESQGNPREAASVTPPGKLENER